MRLMRDDAAVQAIELMARATVEVTAWALAEATTGLDVSLLQWRALLIVGDDPAGARVGKVGDGVGVPLPAASRLVQRLQRRGLVNVERDPDDGRATRVRLTHAGSRTRSAVLARRRTLISEALGHTVLPAEAVQGLRVVAERFERIGREIPAEGTGPSWGPERGTMSESETHETVKTGGFAAGEERTPEKDAEQRVHARGGFGVGQEEKPAEDAEKRAHPGTFGDAEPKA
jgi:DNA-binding MarR family transcriptional regulator